MRAFVDLGLTSARGRVPELLPLQDYDQVIVAFSGGKDSVACVLELIERHVDRRRIELWHHLVDGDEGSDLMDWPVTRAYCEAFAQAFGLKLLLQWKEGGFEGEMRRQDALTRPTRFMVPGKSGPRIMRAGGQTGKRSTRLRFPQVSADLKVRWCSAYLKIDVAAIALRNDPRFLGTRTLFVTGERAEESANRARYPQLEPHRESMWQTLSARAGKDPGPRERVIDHWRPVHGKTEAQVWELLKRHGVNPHPAYWVGFGRTSCMFCIFGDDHQWATGQELAPERFETIARTEDEFGVTIDRRRGVRERARRGLSYLKDPRVRLDKRRLSQSLAFDEPILLPEGVWEMPPGAFRACGGPV